MLSTPRSALLGAGLALAAPGLARAQVVQRNARIVIGFPAGGSSDIVARLYAERLRGIYAPNLIVEGRVGAALRAGVQHLVRHGRGAGQRQQHRATPWWTSLGGKRARQGRLLLLHADRVRAGSERSVLSLGPQANPGVSPAGPGLRALPVH